MTAVTLVGYGMTGLYVILTADVGLARAGVGDVTHSFTEQVSGRRRDPLADVVNSVACWGDIAFVRDELGRAAAATDRTQATPEDEGHHRGTVCPTNPDYRAALLDRIDHRCRWPVGSPANGAGLTRRFPSSCRLSGSSPTGWSTSHGSSTPC